jgi:hypothetical protein
MSPNIAVDTPNHTSSLTLTPAQQAVVDRFDQPYTARSCGEHAEAVVYVYQALSVIRYILAADGSEISSDRFRAAPHDFEIRRDLLAERFGPRP